MSVVSIPGIIRGGQVEKYGVADRVTCTVAAGQAATGGLLVEASAGDRVVRTAQLASVLVLGVAIHDAAAAAAVTVAMEGTWVLTATAATIASGSKVTPGAAGAVLQAAAADPTSLATLGTSITSLRSVVGRAIQDISSAGTGAVKLTV